MSVDSPHRIKGSLTVYWQEENTFIESRYEPGEELRLIVYEDRQMVLVNEVFYHAAGFSFDATKGHEYLIRLMKNGRDKLVAMSLENYISEGKTQDSIST